MFKKHKTPTPARARKMSKEGHSRHTQRVVDSCVDTLDKYIACSAADGRYSTTAWFHNNSGFLTPAAMDVVKEYYSKLGYNIEIEDNGPEFDGDREHYQVTLSWEEAAC